MEKERRTLEDAAARLMASALGSGAQAAEVCGNYGQRSKIALEKQDFHLASHDFGYNLGVKVLVGNRQGFASCNSSDASELKEIALRAVEIAGFSPPNPNYLIAASANVPQNAPTAPWDETLANVSLETQKEWTQLMAEEAMRDPRFRLNEASLGTSTSLSLVLNSKGTHKVEQDCSLYWTVMGMAIEGEQITSFDYFSDLSRQFDQTPEKIQRTTRQFSDHLIRALRTGPGRSYRGLVVFSPRAVCDILTSVLAHHLNGRVLAEKNGRWTPADSGSPVIDERLTLRDRPWLTDRAGFGLFDREGTPTTDRVLIENGHLKGWLLDNYAAHALAMASTGNAVGGPSAPASVSAHSLVLDGGSEKLESALQRLAATQDEFLVVQRFSGQSDPITGEFSGVAKGGEWWSHGAPQHYVKETLIAGNVFDALQKGVFSVSRETEVVDASEESPTIILDGVSVTCGPTT